MHLVDRGSEGLNELGQPRRPLVRNDVSVRAAGPTRKPHTRRRCRLRDQPAFHSFIRAPFSIPPSPESAGLMCVSEMEWGQCTCIETTHVHARTYITHRHVHHPHVPTPT